MHPVQNSASFVIRIWSEPDTERRQVWRGHIRHVQSSQATYFAEADRMFAFMEEITGSVIPLSSETEETEELEPGEDIQSAS